MDEIFVLLDDCNASASQPTSRLYRGFVREHRCSDAASLDAVWQSVRLDQQAGLHAALLADYEWGAKLQSAGTQRLADDDRSALRVLMFSHLELLDSEAVQQWLAKQDGQATATVAGIRDVQTSVDAAHFEADIARIRELIRCGETYQVNYTLRLNGTPYGSPWGLYRRLRAMQPVAYGALAQLPATEPGAQADRSWVLSSSPELFVRHRGGQLLAKPMKGTAPRAPDATVDAQRTQWLQNDAKNRAENVMIVDLLRNDLGRIAETGTVQVSGLFAIETYQTVHQMTSTVQARLRAGVQMPDILRALFPCGSITGAPKLHTMDLIAGLESTPRGLYCGAMGWVDTPTEQADAGDFCLSVAIRTMVLDRASDGARRAQLGIGSGVVMDSNARDEYAEIQTKARFLTAMDPGFTLFETLRVVRNKVASLHLHLQRLERSARTFGFAFDAMRLQQAVQERLVQMQADQRYRLRLDLRHDGSVALQHTEISRKDRAPVRLVLSANLVEANEAALLNHKTSLRSSYDNALRKAMDCNAFDAIFVNANGEVTEGARSNLFVKLEGRWWTAPLGCGVLPGILRGRLMRHGAHIGERKLSLPEVLAAQDLLVCNALRGVLRAQWLRDAQGQVVRV